MSNHQIGIESRAQPGPVSALGVERTVALIFGGLSVMAFLILTAVGHEPASTGEEPLDPAIDAESVFTQSELPGVDMESAE